MANVNESTIYNWFDKCGVISNIRTQLRQNLIDALKSKDLTLTKPHARSAKQYVFDLLIGEYLLKTNFAYTLSVFTSEAPLPAYFDHLLTRPPESTDDNDVKLQNDYLQHVLESLGINPQDSMGHFILSSYATRNESLLICLLQCLKLCSYENNKTTLNNKASQTETTDNNCERCKYLIHVEKKLLKQKERFDSVLRQKSEKLISQAQLTEQQLVLLQEKMDQAQSLMNSLNAKRKHFAEERRIENERYHQKKLQLVHKEEFLTREINRLELERSSYKQFEENLQRLQNELTKLKRNQNGETKTVCETRDVQIQTEEPSFMSNSNDTELLLREKEDLTSLVHEQRLRINQLTHRAVQLSRQLEQAHLLRTNVTPITSTKLMGTFLSEASSTEDILLDAKTRLKRLEKESEEAEKRYHEYILKSTLTN